MRKILSALTMALSGITSASDHDYVEIDVNIQADYFEQFYSSDLADVSNITFRYDQANLGHYPSDIGVQFLSKDGDLIEFRQRYNREKNRVYSFIRYDINDERSEEHYLNTESKLGIDTKVIFEKTDGSLDVILNNKVYKFPVDFELTRKSLVWVGAKGSIKIK